MRFYYKPDIFDRAIGDAKTRGVELGMKNFFLQVMALFEVPYNLHEMLWDNCRETGSALPIYNPLWGAFLIKERNLLEEIRKESDERYEKQQNENSTD